MNKIELAKLDQICRGATIKIAASNASILSKKTADYICDGTADEAEINAAIASLEGIGGCVELSEGTFNLGDFININQNNIWLKGQGESTIIDCAQGVSYVAAYANGKISDLCIKNGLLNGILQSSEKSLIVDNVKIYDCKTNGIDILGTATITNCTFTNNEYGIRIASNAVDCIITNNRLTGNTLGDYLDEGTGTVIANNILTGGAV